MPLSYLLSFVEVYLGILDFDLSRGCALRQCSRSFRQFADPEGNLADQDTYTTYLVDIFFEALQDRDIERDFLAPSAEADSDDY